MGEVTRTEIIKLISPGDWWNEGNKQDDVTDGCLGPFSFPPLYGQKTPHWALHENSELRETQIEIILSQQSSPRIPKGFPPHFSPTSSPSCYACWAPYSPRAWPLWLDIIPLFIKLDTDPDIWFLTKTLFQGVDMERKRGIIFKCTSLAILIILY